LTSAPPQAAVFLGHGSPLNAIEDNEFRRGWQDLARRLPRPRAILCVSAHWDRLCVSAHWDRPGIAVTANARPETIHDFGDFPQTLFDVR
jgi:4,5-DOPA dioxygenase extradiol